MHDDDVRRPRLDVGRRPRLVLGRHCCGIVMTVVLVVLLVAVIIALVFAIRYLSRSGSHYNRASSEATRAEDALAQRFARGEIDEDEYRRRMTLLREHR